MKKLTTMTFVAVLVRCAMVASVLVCAACGHHSNPKPTPPGHNYPKVDLDPTFKWAPSTTACDGTPVTVDGYNIYVIQGAGPIPTIQTPATELPCGATGVVDTTKVTPFNTTLVPVTACVAGVCSYATTLPKGTYTVAVEAILQGSQSGASNQLTFSVIPRSNAPTSVQVTK